MEKLSHIEEQILTYLRVHKKLSTKLALERLDTTRMTLYRAFKRLEKMGLALTRHGAIELSSSSPTIEPDFASKAGINALLKDKIADWVVKNLIPPGAYIALESGTTVAATIKYLAAKKPLALISNGINVQILASEYLPESEIICAGGTLRRRSMSYVGSETNSFFAKHHTDICLISATAVHTEYGIMDLEVETKRAICSNASKSYLLVDSSKFQQRSLLSFGGLDSVSAIVTDSNLEKSIAAKICQMGITLHTV